MIKRCKPNQINDVMKIWLQTNIETHCFISKETWHQYYDEVKAQLPLADVFVYMEEKQIKGFIGITGGNHIAGLFVGKNSQGKGIGKSLIQHCQEIYSRLTLSVYAENGRGVRFYKKNGFTIIDEHLEKDSGALEYNMLWKK